MDSGQRCDFVALASHLAWSQGPPIPKRACMALSKSPAIRSRIETYKALLWLWCLSQWAKGVVHKQGFGGKWNVGPYSPQHCKFSPAHLDGNLLSKLMKGRTLNKLEIQKQTGLRPCPSRDELIYRWMQTSAISIMREVHLRYALHFKHLEESITSNLLLELSKESTTVYWIGQCHPEIHAHPEPRMWL